MGPSVAVTHGSLGIPGFDRKLAHEVSRGKEWSHRHLVIGHGLGIGLGLTAFLSSLPLRI